MNMSPPAWRCVYFDRDDTCQRNNLGRRASFEMVLCSWDFAQKITRGPGPNEIWVFMEVSRSDVTRVHTRSFCLPTFRYRTERVRTNSAVSEPFSPYHRPKIHSINRSNCFRAVRAGRYDKVRQNQYVSGCIEGGDWTQL